MDALEALKQMGKLIIVPVIQAAEAEGVKLKSGTCGVCGERCVYVTYPHRAYWVHEASGNFRSQTPEPHDCNTSIRREES